MTVTYRYHTYRDIIISISWTVATVSDILHDSWKLIMWDCESESDYRSVITNYCSIILPCTICLAVSIGIVCSSTLILFYCIISLYRLGNSVLKIILSFLVHSSPLFRWIFFFFFHVFVHFTKFYNRTFSENTIRYYHNRYYVHITFG